MKTNLVALSVPFVPILALGQTSGEILIDTNYGVINLLKILASRVNKPL